MWFCQGLFDWERNQSVETLLRAVEHAKGPCAIFLDSSEVLDTVALLHALQCRPAPADLIAVGWDNPRIPSATRFAGANSLHRCTCCAAISNWTSSGSRLVCLAR